MKFYRISILLNNNNSNNNFKDNHFYNGANVYNNLYNDYFRRKNKKEEMKNNMLSNESELYSFSPLINKSGYITFGPNNAKSLSTNNPYKLRYDTYMKNNPYQKYSEFIDNYPSGRKTSTEKNNYYSNYFDKYNNNPYYKNNQSQTHFNSSNIKKKFRSHEISNLIKTDYGFYNPKRKRKKIRLNNVNDINSKISEYLNDFHNNNKRINSYNFMNNANNDLYPIKIDKNNNKNRGSKYEISSIAKERLYNSSNKKNKIFDKFSDIKSNNKSKGKLSDSRNQKKYNNINLNYNNKKDNNDKYKKNNERIYNKSNDYFYVFNKENRSKTNKNSNANISQKNSNLSLNPSSLGVDQIKTFYTNKPNNLNIAGGITSNVNSASERMLDTQYHFLSGLKMTSGEVNEYFYDFNNVKKGDKNDEILSLQSLNDSKMKELANRYLSEEDDSTEKYQMNNIIYNKKKFNVK